ncbi:MAG: DeoR/GlpR transcriptional regulator [Lachnospiraceae bacterium]|jgi:DeoR/GlpR family transcriptional regulator of sugar metabolism|nr:DeoR/GlpR transcriptional regulator [Lachnospiraceae bacterium]MCI9660624.1 DeoR/GlpR transcriptional regulator [Lachnospiraceae bacterium]NBH99035.1 DeoR/GlpR transcriptional regulator [Lachnospiraceae bacterium]NBI76269.1 DeoR/GlpR transcriptional regulator [Lachnospiraceae bacterium]RKJ82208.1 DeoR/GlpR transcriptional regulator [Anaerotruncus sp. 1XD22-93]
MLIEERLNKIVEIIRINDSARIEELAETLEVSRDTVRRDLIRLENEGVIKRTHGGAVLNDNRASIVFYDERKNQKLESKKAMGRCAAKLIKKDASVIFDASTTVEEVISFLDKKHIFAVTNSLTAATELTQLNDCTIAVLPGRLDHNHLYVTGSDTVQKLNQYNVDYLLLGVYAMDSGGIYTCSESEGAVKAKMLASARKKIAMADSSKFDTTGLIRICTLQDVDILVTDKFPEGRLLEAMQKAGVEIIVAG